MCNVIIKDNKLLNTNTGEILADIKPKFKGWTYEDYKSEFKLNKEIRYLEPMTAYELSEDKLEDYLNTHLVIAEQKFDGHRGLIFITSKGNRVFSRRVSKKTGWFAENTDQVPHIRDINVTNELYGTILDGEILLPIENCTCRDVQSVTGALPETAINNQLEKGLAFINVFDILYYKGINIQKMPLWKRKVYLKRVLSIINSEFLKMCTMYCTQEVYNTLKSNWESYKAEDLLEDVVIIEDIEQQFRNFLNEGKEGLILKNIYGIYEQKRSKAFIKMKAHKTYDVVIMGYEDPSYEVDLDAIKTPLEEWQYWHNPSTNEYWEGTNTFKTEYEKSSIPVTKFACKGWIGAIVFGVWKNGELIEVGRTSGMDEETRKLISENKEKYLGTVIEVEAQGIINKNTGSLQHPRFLRLRPDKNSEDCTFKDHVIK